MKFDHSRILLDKINRLFGGINETPGDISPLERDLLLNYLRELYDHLQNGESTSEKKGKVSSEYETLLQEKEEALKASEKARLEAEALADKERKRREDLEKKAFEEYQQLKKLESEEQMRLVQEKEEASKRQMEEEARKKALEEIHRKAAEEAAKKKREEEELKARELAEKQAQVSTKVEEKPESHIFSEDFEELFHYEETRELSQKISSRPINNIKKSISINDRLLMINELFDGNSSAFENCVNHMDAAATLEEARKHLESNIISQYDWLARKKKKRAKEFINLVQRSFL